MDLGLSGKAALITGGSRGLGRAAALTLAEEGCDVAIAARTPETLEAAAAEISAKNVKAHAIQADVTVPEDIVRMVESVEQTFGRLDALVANAGASQGGDLLGSDRRRLAGNSGHKPHARGPIHPGRRSADASFRRWQRRHYFVDIRDHRERPRAVRGRQGGRDLPCPLPVS